MAEYGEWNRKGAVLSDVTAEKEYGVTRDFIVKGVQAGELEFREGTVWGNPYLRLLRSQLERYIVAQLGSEYLVSKKSHNELHAIRRRLLISRENLLHLGRERLHLSTRSKHSGSYAAPASAPEMGLDCASGRASLTPLTPTSCHPRCCFRFEERRRFGRLEGVGSTSGDDVPFAPFSFLLGELPGRHAIVGERLKA
jgi:hypothetical protein